MSSNDDPKTGDPGMELKDVSPPDKPPVPTRDYDTPEDSPDKYSTPNKSPIRKKLHSFPRPEFIYKPERSESWMGCLKCSLIVVNFITWMLGAAITGLAIWVIVDKDFWEIQSGVEVKHFITASYVMIAIGIIIMLIGFLGCYGAAKENACMLLIYAIIIIIVILMELAVIGVVWSATATDNAKEEIKLHIKTASSQRYADDAKNYLINLLQTNLKCCGVDGPEDYNKIGNGIPKSCTNPNTGQPFEQGCFDGILEYFKSKAAILGGIAITVFLLQLGSLVFAMCLYCGLRQASKHIF